MRISVKGRNFDISEEVRQKVGKRFEKIGKQVSELAQIEIELSEEKNPSIRESCRAEATLFLKGVTLRSSTKADNMVAAVNECAEDMARQVKRHRDKRRNRRVARAASPVTPAADAGFGGAAPSP
jgi:putative sigma-54 modulation protein